MTALQLELAVERDRRAALELEIDMLKKFKGFRQSPKCKVQHSTSNFSVQR